MGGEFVFRSVLFSPRRSEELSGAMNVVEGPALTLIYPVSPRQSIEQKGRAKAQARLADEMAKTSNEWEEIIELLQDCVQRVGAASTASPSPSLGP